MGVEQALIGSGFLGESISQLGGGLTSFFGGMDDAEYTRAMSEINARIAEANAKLALERGSEAQRRFGDYARGIIGSQRASYAAQGVMLGKGTPQEVARDTQQIAVREMEKIGTNAWLEAWGYRMQGTQIRSAGILQQQALKHRAVGGLFSGITESLSAGLKGANILSSYTGGSTFKAGVPAPKGMGTRHPSMGGGHSFPGYEE